jgi:hypothetical protein
MNHGTWKDPIIPSVQYPTWKALGSPNSYGHGIRVQIAGVEWIACNNPFGQVILDSDFLTIVYDTLAEAREKLPELFERYHEPFLAPCPECHKYTDRCPACGSVTVDQ